MSKVPLQRPSKGPLPKALLNALPIGFRVLASTPLEQARQVVDATNDGDEAVGRWLEQLTVRWPRVKNLMHEIAAAMPRVTTHPSFNERDGSFTWVRSYSADDAAIPERAYALAMIRAIDGGFGPRFRRCKLDECRKYFVGDPRSRWCSETCGSKYRVRAKRWRDRQ